MTNAIRGAMRAVVCCIVLGSCSTLTGAARLDSMAQPEFERYVASTSLMFEGITGTAIREEDLTAETALEVAVAIDGLAAGTVAPAIGELAEGLNLGGWAALGISLAILEIDAQLASWGAYSAGWERGSEVLAGIAAGMTRAAAPMETAGVRAFGAGPAEERDEPFTVGAP